MDEGNSEDEFPVLSFTEVSNNGRKYQAFTPRDYQVELFEHAKNKNSIMVLGTGSGKTYIAVMLLQHFAHQIRGPFVVDGDPKRGAKRTFMIANTVPLVQQQAEVIKQSTSYAVKAYDGSMGVDYWKINEWNNELEKVEVLVMVAEIFRMMLDHKFIDFSRINLLIIDECHHATGNHPMREAMRNYADFKKENPSEPVPRILGLTASVIQKKCKPHEIDGMLKDLEKCLDSQLTTAADYNQVLKFTTNPVEEILQYRPSLCPLSHNGKLVKDWIERKLTTMPLYNDEDAKKSMKKVKRVLTNMLTTLVELGEWCAGRAIDYEKEHLMEVADEEKLPELKTLFQVISKELHELQKECLIRESEMDIQDNLSHQSQRLIAYIRRVIEKFGDDTCGLVFVKTRATAKLLSKLLNHIAKQENDDNFSSNCVVGSHGAASFGDLVASCESLVEQRKVITKFRNREFKILVATSVLEEGIDVQKCNMVVRFNKPDNFRSYVQAKGRARSRVAFYTLMESVEEENVNFMAEITQYRALEKKLHSICDNRCLPMPEEVFDFFDDETLTPFRPYGPNGPKITSSSCLQIVAIYCSRLPSDKFTRLGCSIRVKPITDANGVEQHVAEVQLPKASVIKEVVVGDMMEVKDLAKRSAMLKVCELLHQKNELNDHLLPHSSNSIEEIISKEIGCEGLKTDIGSRKLHPIKVCDAFSTDPGNEYWMYLINIDQKNDEYMDVFTGSNQFALLCSEKIYSCNFPLFHSRWKRAHVTLSDPTKITLCADQLKQALHFNKLIFSTLLRINEDSALTYDRERSDWKVLFLPMNHKKIDDFTLQKCLKYTTLLPEKPDLKVRKEFEFKSSDYEGSVVIPWNISDNTVYYVQKVLDKTPSCCFSNGKFSSYEEYFRDKQDLQIFNKSQKMLQCTGIGPDMNFLNTKKRSNPQKTFDIVPELCLLFPMTGKMFYQMKCLPAILLRLNLLNNAAQYMVDVVKLPLPEVDNNLPLEIDWCRKLTADLVAQDRTDNICTSFQKRDLVRFDEFNTILALGGEVNLIEVANRNIRPEFLMQTLIPAHANDCFDLERLEVLGDAFLKYHVGQLTYFAFENYDEGRLSCVRSKLVSNAMLYKIGVSTELNKILSYKQLLPVQSGPAPGYVIPPAVEKEIKESGCIAAQWFNYKPNETYVKESKIICYNGWTHSLFADKNVADSIEAMLGFALITGSITSAHRMLVKLDMKVMKRPVVIPETALLPPTSGRNLLSPETVYLQYNLDKLENILQYKFRDKSFLLQAITHATFKGNHITDVYQRLEYLGDAILDFLITGYIFTVADLSPGEMTDIRIHFVRNETLAKACVQNSIHKFILHNCTVLKNAIKNYIEDLDLEQCDSSSSDSEDDKSPKRRRREGSTEEESPTFCEEKGRNTESDDVECEDIEVPKVLGDVVEAIIGAVYIDSRCSLEATWKVVKTLIPDIVKDKKFSNVESDWRKQLHETYGNVMEMNIKLPETRKDKFIVTIRIEGFPVLCGAGKNKRLATIAAAKLVMKRHNINKSSKKPVTLA